ncbi:MAG: hypothetical protein RDV41_07175 [Planctomycetota bacterium]|nr:hypothetical protein [Planctomycetota bacterium]
MTRTNSGRRAGGFAAIYASSFMIGLLALGCSGTSGPVRVVPAGYDKFAGKVRTIAVCAFENATSENKTSAVEAANAFVNPVIDKFPEAGGVLREYTADILSGKDFGRTTELLDRADGDISTPHMFTSGKGDAPAETPFQAAGCDAVVGAKAAKEDVLKAASASDALLGGRVESIVVHFSPGTGEGSGPVATSYSTGTIRCRVAFALYDGKTGAALMERTVSLSTLFSHGSFREPMDKIYYAQACVHKTLYNAAWQFLSDLIPHYQHLSETGESTASGEPVRFVDTQD